MVTEQFPNTVLQGNPGIIHFVYQENVSSCQLTLRFLYPLQLSGILGRLVVGVVIGNADCQYGGPKKCAESAGMKPRFLLPR